MGRASRDERATRRAVRRALREQCPRCGHPWSEHRGAGVEAEELEGCGECRYEIDHGFWTPRPLCPERVPSVVRIAEADGVVRLRPPTGPTGAI